jgi:hypothetical protein
MAVFAKLCCRRIWQAKAPVNTLRCDVRYLADVNRSTKPLKQAMRQDVGLLQSSADPGIPLAH